MALFAQLHLTTSRAGRACGRRSRMPPAATRPRGSAEKPLLSLRDAARWSHTFVTAEPPASLERFLSIPSSQGGIRPWPKSLLFSTTIPSTATPSRTRATISPNSTSYPGGQTLPTPESHRLQAGRAAGQRLGRAGPAQVSRKPGPHPRRHLRQGRPQLGVRARVARRRHRDLAAVLARLPDQGAHRQGEEAEAGDHRRHRLRPRRPASRAWTAASPSRR